MYVTISLSIGSPDTACVVLDVCVGDSFRLATESRHGVRGTLIDPHATSLAPEVQLQVGGAEDVRQGVHVCFSMLCCVYLKTKKNVLGPFI